MSHPLVSVITPASDAAVYLLRAVASVLGQSHWNLEHIVVAQDHLDYEAQLRRAGIADRRLEVIATDRPGESTASALNAGLAHARGTIIAPLMATDLFYANRLERLVPLVQQFGAATDNRRIVDERTRRVLGTLMPLDGRMRIFGRLAFLRIMTPLSLVVRREFIEPGWSTQIGETHQLLANLRTVAACKQIPVVPEPLHELRLPSDREVAPFTALTTAAEWPERCDDDGQTLGRLDVVSNRMLALHARRLDALCAAFQHSAFDDAAQFLGAAGQLVPPGAPTPPAPSSSSIAA